MESRMVDMEDFNRHQDAARAMVARMMSSKDPNVLSLARANLRSVELQEFLAHEINSGTDSVRIAELIATICGRFIGNYAGGHSKRELLTKAIVEATGRLAEEIGRGIAEDPSSGSRIVPIKDGDSA